MFKQPQFFNSFFQSKFQKSKSLRTSYQLLELESLEDRVLLSANIAHAAGVDVVEGFSLSEWQKLESIQPNSSLGSQTPPLQGAQDGGHEPDVLTFVLDFKQAFQGLTTDVFGNVVSAFDVTSFGFTAGQFNAVVNAIAAEVDQDYFTELVGTVAGPAGRDLRVDFIVGDIGTAPVGVSEYYFVQIGTGVSGPHTGGGILGVASGSGVRTQFGAPGSANVGDVVASVFTDVINGLGGLTPVDALTTGDFNFTTNAVSGTLSHEIGHTVSLSHINTVGSVQPTLSRSPIMGTGAIDLPNQDRITDREFSLSGIDGESGDAPRRHIQQLRSALGLHNFLYDDHGNSGEFSTTILAPSTTAGDINPVATGSPADVDFFRFVAVHGASYTATALLGSLSPGRITLYGSDATTQLDTDTGTTGSDPVINWFAPATATYYLSVDGLGVDLGTYDLVLTVNDDHGDDSGTATAVAVNSVTPGVLEFQTDVDFFSFDAERGRTYRLATTYGAELDSTLTLFGVDGVTELAFDDDGGLGYSAFIEWVAPEDGTYFLKVDNFSNFTSQVGPYTLIVDLLNGFVGSDGNDTFILDVTASGIFATLNGKKYDVDIAAGTIKFDGLGGTDILKINGGVQNETAYLRDNLTTVLAAEYRLDAVNFENVSMNSGGGIDSVWMYDTKGRDTFSTFPGLAIMQGTSFVSRATGFTNVAGVSNRGGFDLAKLNGSAGADRFYGYTYTASLRGAGYSVRALSFDEVTVNSGGGKDTASLFDSNTGNDKFVGNSKTSVLSGKGFSNTVSGFSKVFGYSSGGDDKAEFTGTSGEEKFTGRTKSARLKGSDFSLKVLRFGDVTVSGEGGTDTARLYDSNKNDTLVGTSKSVLLQGSKFKFEIDGFEKVFVFASRGTDTVDLTGTNQSDTFKGRGTQGSLTLGSASITFRKFDSAKVDGAKGIDTLDIRNLKYKLNASGFEK